MLRLRSAHHRLRQRMAHRLSTPPRSPTRPHEIDHSAVRLGHFGLTMRDRAGLVERDGFQTSQILQMGTPLTSTPFRAACATPVRIAAGVAKASAQGDAATSTVMARQERHFKSATPSKGGMTIQQRHADQDGRPRRPRS